MTVLVVHYDTVGNIQSWRYEASEEYEAGDSELIADGVDHRNLGSMMVDTEADPTELVEDPNWTPTPSHEDLVKETPVRRAQVSSETRSAIATAYDDLQTARSNDDQQSQIDALETIVDQLTDVVTGDTLEEIS